MSKLAIFEDKEIRRIKFDDEWYYAVEDIVLALTDSADIKQYIKKLRKRDIELNTNWGTICTPLPLIAKDGRKRNVNCADTEGVFRIIQSVPSQKAEPFKRWLARLGKERIDEIEQPGKAVERARNYYLAKGYSKHWVQTRVASIDTRYEFTDTLKEKGISESRQYAILTNEMYSSTFGMKAIEYKEFKGLNKQDSLRDNMTPLEFASTIFSEATSTEIINKIEEEGFHSRKKT